MLDTIRTLILLVVQKSWKLFQLGVKLAFLNGVLQERYTLINLSILRLLELKSRYTDLKKALYGLRQAPKDWYEEIDTHFHKCSFKGVLVKLPCTSRLEVNMNPLLCQYMWMI